MSIALSVWAGAVAWRDAATRRIPNAFIAVLLLPAIGVLAATGRGLAGAGWIDSILGCAIGAAVLLPGYLWQGKVGAGDVKLAAAAGLVLGWARTCEMMLIAAIVLGVVSALVLMRPGRKAGERIAAGPAIAAGFALELLGGPFVLNMQG